MRYPPPTSEPVPQTYDDTVVYVPDPDGGYVAEVPTLGIATQGETVEEARAMAHDAIRGTHRGPGEGW